MWFIFKSKFLKSTSGAALLAVAPTLALKAQGGTSSTNAAVSVFEKLGNKMGLTGKSAKVFKYSAYTVVTADSVFLLYCIVMFVENKMALNILENGLKNKLEQLTEKVRFVKGKLTEIKGRLESLKVSVNSLEEDVWIQYNWGEVPAKKEEEIIEENKEIQKYVQLMRDSKIYDDFEKDYFKLDDRKDDAESIEALRKTRDELKQALINEGNKVGKERRLEYKQVKESLKKLGKSEEYYEYPDDEEIEEEIEKRVEKEKESNSEVYKAYLRFKLVESFTYMLELKKGKAVAEMELNKIANVDFAKDFKFIQDEVKKIQESVNDLDDSLKDFGGLKNFCDKNCPFGIGNMTYYKAFLNGLERFRIINFNELIDQPGICSGSFEGIISHLDDTMKNLVKPKNLEKTLKNNLETKRKNMKNKSFFRIPGKQIAEAQSFNFDD